MKEWFRNLFKKQFPKLNELSNKDLKMWKQEIDKELNIRHSMLEIGDIIILHNQFGGNKICYINGFKNDNEYICDTFEKRKENGYETIIYRSRDYITLNSNTIYDLCDKSVYYTLLNTIASDMWNY